MSDVILVLSCVFLAFFGAHNAELAKNRQKIKKILQKLKFMLKYFVLIIFFINTNSYANVEDFNTNKENYNAKLQIFAKNREIVDFKVAIVHDSALQQYGLMNLQHLDERNGMLFIFEEENIINMWMKDTFIALDMIFIDKNDVIVSLSQNAKPLALTTISSQKKVNKVLEINAGLIEKYKIKIGQNINYENF